MVCQCGTLCGVLAGLKYGVSSEIANRKQGSRLNRSVTVTRISIETSGFVWGLCWYKTWLYWNKFWNQLNQRVNTMEKQRDALHMNSNYRVRYEPTVPLCHRALLNISKSIMGFFDPFPGNEGNSHRPVLFTQLLVFLFHQHVINDRMAISQTPCTIIKASQTVWKGE